ncbi:hypothetical protein [Flagellimonas meridianipacifica]|nr:hypothetical protein [Allomuricauda pacifica]
MKVLVTFLLLGMTQNIQGQFLKKLKQNLEDKVEKKVDKEINVLLDDKKPTTPEQENKVGQVKKVPQENKTVSNTTKGGVNTINETNIITYKAPSSDFIDIVIQSHKGLPRYGDIHYRRGVTTPVNKNGYKALVELKYLKKTYADINRSKLTSYQEKSSGDQKQENSYFAQSHLKNLAGYTCSEEVLKKYFCDESDNSSNLQNKNKVKRKIPCEFVDRYGDRRPPSYWGGSRGNEFQQQRSYKGFLENHLQALQSWADTFYENDEQIVYYVCGSGIQGKYDFKNKGYWLAGLMGGGSFMLHSSNFLAYSENEKKIKNSRQQFFFSIDPQKAKEFNLQERVPVNCVFKVKVFPKVVNHTQVQLEFELVDQTIEIYSKNPALTEKLGEINIENIQSKY